MKTIGLFAVLLSALGLTTPLREAWADAGFVATAPLQQSQEEEKESDDEEPDCE